MALPLPPGLTPKETAFVCEMETVTVVPRQRLESLRLLGLLIVIFKGLTPALIPPRRVALPLWLALLLKRQRRANIVPPLWLTPTCLGHISEAEKSSEGFMAAPSLPASNISARVPLSPPFIHDSTATPAAVSNSKQRTSAARYNASDTYDSEQGVGGDFALPYHWLELAHLLLSEAADDIPMADTMIRLVRDLREVRMAKLRAGVAVLEGTRETVMSGVGAMEVAEARAFISGVVDELRILGASAEAEKKERDEEEGINGENSRNRGNDDADDDDDEDMG